jgi:CMP/dCMP kinase
MIIAIDGPAASGKGTLGKRLAAHYGLRHLDTGLIYRAVAKAVLDAGHSPDSRAHAAAAAKALDPEKFDAPALKSQAMGEAASLVSAMPEVRGALLAFQRAFGRTPPGAVLDGRDIGTVVWPEAGAKIFVDAGPDARAWRRHKELLERGLESIYSRVLQDMRERDARDRGRQVAPLIPAPDALVIDSSTLDADGVYSLAVAHIDRILPNLARG